MPFRHDIEGCFGASGLGRDAFEAHLACWPAVRADLAARRDDGRLPLLRLPARRDDLAPLRTIAANWRRRFRRIVVFGAGGSSLGAKTLLALRRSDPDGPLVSVIDSIDPPVLAALAADPALAETGFVSISKSGGTAETLAQTLILLDALAAAGIGDPALRLLLVSAPGDSPLRRLAARTGAPVLEHDPLIGGRFSVLSLVGLLPALLAGLDADAVRAGAARVLDPCLDGAADAMPPPPALGAALALAARDAGLSQSVLLAYGDGFAPFTRWYRQLWAESLGKAGHGTTPLDALGPVDQHSQLQLYLEGPADKLYTVLSAEVAGTGPRVPAGLARAIGADDLAGQAAGSLIDAMRRGTTDSLIAHRRPVRRIHLARFDEHGLGALLMHFMLETMIVAGLIGIDAFDQPAVDDGKRRAREYLAAEADGAGAAAGGTS